jgi:mono/diheme cytochrome c family protein
VHRRLNSYILIAALLAPSSVLAQDQALVEAGAEVYQTHCAECHGDRLVNPGSSFDLKRLGADERPRFDTSVANGKGQMPAWGGVLGSDDMDRLWAYIRSRADR